MPVRSLGQEDPLEKDMVTHSSVLVWRIPWTGEPGRLQSLGLQRVWHNWSDLPCMHTQLLHIKLTNIQKEYEIHIVSFKKQPIYWVCVTMPPSEKRNILMSIQTESLLEIENYYKWCHVQISISSNYYLIV